MKIFKLLTNKHLNNIYVYKSENNYTHGHAGQTLLKIKKVVCENIRKIKIVILLFIN